MTTRQGVARAVRSARQAMLSGLQVLPSPLRQWLPRGVATLGLAVFSVAAQAPGDLRLALVIGNGAYPGAAALTNPANDAKAMSETLRALGFTVVELRDGNRAAITEAIVKVRDTLKGKQGIGMLYYAGHGLQLDWHNYMVPVDARLSKAADVPAQTVDLSTVIDAFKTAGNRMNIVVLDACRDNPFAGTASGKGLAQLDAPPGTFLAYATAPGNVAEDGDSRSGNGLYTQYLLEELKKPITKIEDVFKRVRLNVRKQSQGRQIPWESTSLEDDFFFNDGVRYTFKPDYLERLAREAKQREELRLQQEEQARRREQQLAAELARERERQAAEAKAFEQQRLAAEARAKEQEEQRIAAEARAKEQARLAAEAKARELEQQRLSAEARAKEQARLAAEAKALELEQQRVNAEARAREQARLAAEARAREAQRLAQETQARERERLLAEAQKKAREAQEEAARQAEQERLAAAKQLKEAQERQAAEAQAPAKAREPASKQALQEAKEREFAAARADWERIRESKNADDFFEYLKKYPTSELTEQAQFQLDQLAKPKIEASLGKGQDASLGYRGARLRLNDRFSFAVKDGLTGLPLRDVNRNVTAINGDVVEINRGRLLLTPLGATIETEIEGVKAVFNPPIGGGLAEYQVGKKFEGKSTVTRSDGRIRSQTYSGKVVGIETITVPAGTFQTYRIETQVFISGGGAPDFTRTTTFWIDPRYGQPIKYSFIQRNNGRIRDSEVWEMTSLKADRS